MGQINRGGCKDYPMKKIGKMSFFLLKINLNGTVLI